ncbi:MAG: phosphorylase [Dehalococcoidia bacterium]
MAEELEHSLLTARGLIAWRGGAPAAVPESVILTHQESLVRALAPRFRTGRIAGLFPQLRVLPGTGGRAALAGRIGLGGPATAMAVEELAAAGVQRIVMVDVAASINDGLAEGDLLVVEDAVAADGTSRHYLPLGTELTSGDAGLFARLLAALQHFDRARDQKLTSHGRVASTDAPFRETATLLESFRDQKAGLVDMETAALFASAAALGVEAASLLVVGDRLLDAWHPPVHRRALQARLVEVADVAKGVLLQ